jgi:hypothetical protein
LRIPLPGRAIRIAAEDRVLRVAGTRRGSSVSQPPD